MGDECCACAEGANSPIQGFAGPIILTGHRGCHEHDGDVVHVESQGSGAPGQEGPPLIFPVGVLLVCV
jgi:hypothetical protein